MSSALPSRWLVCAARVSAVRATASTRVAGCGSGSRLDRAEAGASAVATGAATALATVIAGAFCTCTVTVLVAWVQVASARQTRADAALEGDP